jgi:hypothetical protein
VLPNCSPTDAADVVADLARTCRLVLARVGDRSVPTVPARPQPADVPTAAMHLHPIEPEENPMQTTAPTPATVAAVPTEVVEPETSVRGRLLYGWAKPRTSPSGPRNDTGSRGPWTRSRTAPTTTSSG